MTFHAVKSDDLPASSSPVRLVDEQGREIEWANRVLDIQRVRGLQVLSLCSYAYTLLHFVRWWSRRPGVDVMSFRPSSSPNPRWWTMCATNSTSSPNQLPRTLTAAPSCCVACSTSTSTRTCPTPRV